MSIMDFINSHPLISWRAVENMIGAPAGTIRVNNKRSVPSKYWSALIPIITAYGYDSEEPPEDLQQPVQAASDMIAFTYIYGSLRYVSTDGINRSIRPEGTVVYIHKNSIELPFDYEKCI